MSSLKEKFIQEFRNKHGQDICFKAINDDFLSCFVNENDIKYFVTFICYKESISVNWKCKFNQVDYYSQKHRLEKSSYYLIKEEQDKIISYGEQYFLYGQKYSKEDFLKHPDNKKIIAKKRFLNNQ